MTGGGTAMVRKTVVEVEEEKSRETPRNISTARERERKALRKEWPMIVEFVI